MSLEDELFIVPPLIHSQVVEGDVPSCLQWCTTRSEQYRR